MQGVVKIPAGAVVAHPPAPGGDVAQFVRVTFGVPEETYLAVTRRGGAEGGRKIAAAMTYDLILADGSKYGRPGTYLFAERELDIATGTLPYRHGVVANEWIDVETGRSVYCVEDPDVQLVGPSGSVPGTGMSPRNIVGESIGDRLRRATNGASRVFALAQKDRAAVPLGGRTANAASV